MTEGIKRSKIKLYSIQCYAALFLDENMDRGESMKKKIFLVAAICGAMCSQTALAAEFSDVPATHWASKEITKASEVGFISGVEANRFGLGETVTRGQFVSMMCRMFGWEKASTATGSFTDNQDTGMWYFPSIETAVQHKAVDAGGNFRPNAPITREEMAVMLIKGLGYDSLAGEAEKDTRFTDVSSNKGYINLAYDFGIVSGKGEGRFLPAGTATREEAAAMMIRCYDKLQSNPDFIHGFYAFSSYSQKDAAKEMDAVSFGWSRMEYRDGEGVVVNTLSENHNEWIVPEGYEQIVNELQANGVQTNLNVFLSDVAMAEKILGSAENRTAAVNGIMEEVTVAYKKLGRNPYEGVTIDFEGLRGSAMKQNFTAFLRELDGKLEGVGKKLYVAVHPATKDGVYFDGYDFKAIGEIADKVILMAYDYEAKSISQEVQNSGFTTTPVAPIDAVYHGLKTIGDKNTGIADKNKIVLGLSPSANVEWDIQNGIVVNEKGIRNEYQTIKAYIQNGAKRGYSEKYKSPYLEVQDGDITKIIWYEDSKSVEDKKNLMQMMGIKGISLWRLGLIPDEILNEIQ